jgi:hypothetical protein
MQAQLSPSVAVPRFCENKLFIDGKPAVSVHVDVNKRTSVSPWFDE